MQIIKKKMAKSRATSQPQKIDVTFLTMSKEDFRKKIKERIELGEDLFKIKILTVEDYHKSMSDFAIWNDYNLELLKQAFNIPYNEYRKSYEYAGEWNGISISTMGSRPTAAEQAHKITSKMVAKIDNLKKLAQKIDLLKSEIPDSIKTIANQFDMNQVFIVHGHDDLAKVETARFVEKLGFKPIILHEQASSGKTIIEKIEEYSNVGFGIVLYTPCDIGAKLGDESNLRSRARQNVVFEHGYLIGKIGRENVCALIKGDIEKPNDISGVVYVSMDGEWKLTLAKELRNSGYIVDMNLVI